MEGDMRLGFAALALVIGLAACDPQASIGPRVGEAVRAQEQALIAAIAAEDTEAALALQAPDAEIYVPFQAPETTPDAIRAGFQALFDDPNGSLVFTPENLILPSSADYAISEGAYAASFSGPNGERVTSNGRYMTIWRLQDDGSWKIIREVSTPGPAAPPAPANP